MTQPIHSPSPSGEPTAIQDLGTGSEQLQLSFLESMGDRPLSDPNYPTPLTDSTGDRTILFVDGSNLFYAAAQLKIEVDYAKLLNYFQERFHVLYALFYTGYDPKNTKQQGFLLWMRRNGYRVITKELPVESSGMKRANLNVEIAVDMLGLTTHCDREILLSGDGDLAYAVRTIAYHGRPVEVVALRSMLSDRLLAEANRYTDLADIQQDIRKHPKR